MDRLLKITVNVLLSIVSAVSFSFILDNSNIILMIFVFGIILFLYLSKHKKITISMYLISFILTFFTWIANCMLFIWSEINVNLKLIITPIGLFIFYVKFISWLFLFLETHKLQEKIVSISNKKLFIISFFVILLSWVPAWIAEYPNSISPDTMAQFGQIFNAQAYSNGNPLIHTLLVGIIFRILSIFFNQINQIIAIESIVFAIGNSLVFSYASIYCYKRTKNIVIYIFSLLFYSLLNINVMYGIQISKDTFFAVFTLLFIIQIDKYLNNQSKKNALLLLLIGVIFSLGRKNGYYQLIATAVLVIPLLKQIKFRKLFIIFLVVIIVSHEILGPVYKKIIEYANNDLIINEKDDAVYSSDGKKLGIGVGVNLIPLQQLSYIVYRDWSLTDYQKELLEKLAPFDMIRETYDPYIYDPMGKLCGKYGDPSFYDVDRFEYTKIYFQLLLKHPFDFIESYVAMTSSYFYPGAKTSLYSTKMTDNNYGIEKTYLVSKQYTDCIERFYYNQNRNPITVPFINPGLVTYLMIIIATYFLVEKRFETEIVILPLLMNILILLTAVPINGEFRYYYPVTVCLPFVLSCLLKSNSDNENTAL